MPAASRRSVIAEIGSLVGIGCATYSFQSYVIGLAQCLGPSMLPTFNIKGDVVLINRLAGRVFPYQVGDIVICKSPSNPNLNICKRVMGLPGQSVTVRSPVTAMSRTVTVPQGHVWLLGDNPDNSTDSRSFGPVPMALLLGRVCYRVLPLGQKHVIQHEPPPALKGVNVRSWR